MDVVANLYTRKGTDFLHTVSFLQASYKMQCVTPGQSANAQPAWSGEVGQVTLDGAARWKTIGVTSSQEYIDIPSWQPDIEYGAGQVVHSIPPVVDLTGYSASWLLQKSSSDATVIFDHAVGPNVVIDGPAGQVKLILPIAEVDALNFQTANYALTVTSPPDGDFPAGKTSLLMHGLMVHNNLQLSNARTIGPGQGDAINSSFTPPSDRRTTQLIGAHKLV